ncbi:MAG: CocE/NonD family hydrolase [Planctomycetota bacterium]|nr:CocE/NonD family hydrolase [Planctomycetota bacterium]
MTASSPAVRSETLHVPMCDGALLSVHVHRPADPGRYPVVMGYTPYNKGRLGGPPPIVAHGYVSVLFDVRGTGNSGGSTDSVYCDAERQDGYDMVEWCAAQPWSNGNVGMWGISYGAVVALQIAAAAPPSLKAIIARSGSDDPYTEWTNTGYAPRPYIWMNYASIMSAFNFSPPDPEELGDRWESTWRERLEKNVPWGVPFMRQMNDGPFWRDRSLRDKYDRVKCAVYVVDGWADWYVTPLMRIFSKLSVPKKALMGPWGHQWPDGALPGPRLDFEREAVRWFDQWLKGIDTGVMKSAPVTLFVREYSKPEHILVEDHGRFRGERDWPIPRAAATSMHFAAGGKLASAPPSDPGHDLVTYDPRVGAATGMHGGGPYSINWVMPLDQRHDEIDSLVYTSDPLDDDTEVIGQPRAELHVSSTAPGAMVMVKLCDVAPDGTSALVTKGYLNLAYRDAKNPAPLEPGKVHAVAIDLLACAYRFVRGHRIRMMIAGGDLLNIWPSPHAATHAIHRGPAHPSHVVLPVVKGVDPAAGAMDLQASIHPLPRREDLKPPAFSVARNITQQTASVSYQESYGPHRPHSAEMTVSGREPAKAEIRADARCHFEYPGKTISVDARTVTSSDADVFRHSVRIEITVNGEKYFEKGWIEALPRGLM